jgi:chloride channel 7
VCCPQAYLNGIDVPGIFLVSTLVAKMLGSIGAVAAGLAVGKEGPFVHAGAAIGALLSQVGAGEDMNCLMRLV